MNTKYFSIFIFALLMLSIPLSMQDAEAELSQTGVRIFVEKGPKDVFVNETTTYKVRIGGSFAEDAENWTLKTSVDIDATVEDSVQESNTTNVFSVKITFKEKGDANVKFKAFCGKGGETRYTEDSLKIDATKPVTTKVKIENPTDYELNNIKVGLFVDGDLLNVTTVDKLGAEEKKTLTMKWSKEGYSSGEHIVEVWVDYKLGDDQEFNKEQKVLEKTFYIEGDDNLGLIVAIVVIASVSGFLLYYFYSKGKSRRRKPWKK